jgi:hypothetical protein
MSLETDYFDRDFFYFLPKILRKIPIKIFKSGACFSFHMCPVVSCNYQINQKEHAMKVCVGVDIILCCGG